MKIAIIGMGYAGGVISACFIETGIGVIFVSQGIALFALHTKTVLPMAG